MFSTFTINLYDLCTDVYLRALISWLLNLQSLTIHSCHIILNFWMKDLAKKNILLFVFSFLNSTSYKTEGFFNSINHKYRIGTWKYLCDLELLWLFEFCRFKRSQLLIKLKMLYTFYTSIYFFLIWKMPDHSNDMTKSDNLRSMWSS